PIHALAIRLLGYELEPELLAHHTRKEAPHRMLLPAGGLHDDSNRGPARSAQQSKHPRLLGLRSRSVMARDLAAGRLRSDFAGRPRLAGARTLNLGHPKNSSQ